jgi:hypothetical protein
MITKNDLKKLSKQEILYALELASGQLGTHGVSIETGSDGPEFWIEQARRFKKLVNTNEVTIMDSSSDMVFASAPHDKSDANPDGAEVGSATNNVLSGCADSETGV